MVGAILADMDPAKLSARIQRRITDLLAEAGSAGLGRAQLARRACKNDYRRATAEIDGLHARGAISYTGGKYHLSFAPTGTDLAVTQDELLQLRCRSKEDATSARIQNRIVEILLDAGPLGLNRSRIAERAHKGNYRRAAAEIDELHAQGIIDLGKEGPVKGRYQLSLATLDGIALRERSRRVARFFDLATYGGTIYFYQRRDRYDRDVYTGSDVTPTYYMGESTYPSERGSETDPCDTGGNSSDDWDSDSWWTRPEQPVLAGSFWA